MSIQVFENFVDAINVHATGALYSLMAENHSFIDAHGNVVTGRETMKAGWAGYFQSFPDYTIEVTDVFEEGGTIAAFGFASATFKGLKTESNENYWRLPAAWRAIIEDGAVTLWQVYADTKIPFDIISKNK